jgi:hypothetical protein
MAGRDLDALQQSDGYRELSLQYVLYHLVDLSTWSVSVRLLWTRGRKPRKVNEVA